MRRRKYDVCRLCLNFDNDNNNNNNNNSNNNNNNNDDHDDNEDDDNDNNLVGARFIPVLQIVIIVFAFYSIDVYPDY